MLEAMSLGCRIVSTDAPSGPAEFLEFGKQGELVPVGDPIELASAMTRSLSMSVDLNSRRKSMFRFDYDNFVDQYLEYFVDLVGRDLSESS